MSTACSDTLKRQMAMLTCMNLDVVPLCPGCKLTVLSSSMLATLLDACDSLDPHRRAENEPVTPAQIEDVTETCRAFIMNLEYLLALFKDRAPAEIAAQIKLLRREPGERVQ